MTRQSSCLSPQRELSITITYLLQSLVAMLLIPLKQSVKKLDLTLGCHLTTNAHASNIARTCYLELRRFDSIRKFLTSTATATLVYAFVLSRIAYCNSLLFGSTHDVTFHMQGTQKFAARTIVRPPKSSYLTDPNGSCLFAAGLPTDTVCSQNFQTFSTRQTQLLGDK